MSTVLQPVKKKRIRTDRKTRNIVQKPMPERDTCKNGHPWKENARWEQYTGWVCYACKKISNANCFRRRYVKTGRVDRSFRPLQVILNDNSIQIDHHRIWLAGLMDGAPWCRFRSKRIAVRRLVWEQAGNTVKQNERLVNTCGVECCVSLCCLTVEPIHAVLRKNKR